MDFDPAERFRHLTRLWNEREFEQVADAFGTESVFYPDPRWPEPGPHAGEEARAQLIRFAAAWESSELGTYSVEEADGVVLAKVRWDVRGAASGVDAEMNFWMVCRFREDGNIRALHAFFDEDAARAEAAAG